MAGFAVAALASLWVVVASASAASISPASGFHEIRVNSQLGCQLVNSNSQLQFDTGTVDMDNYCGTFLVLDETIYGDDTADENVDLAYDPISNGPVTGSGTSADPYKLTTVVKVIEGQVLTDVAPAQDGEDSLLTITETETYVAGNDYFRTDVTVHNDTTDTLDPELYHAGDCFLHGSDIGFAADDTAQSGAVFCVPGQTLVETESTVPQPGNTPGILGFVPIGGNSHYLEAYAGEGDGNLFDAINGSDFPDECANCVDPTNHDAVDNGTGLSWALDLPGGASATRCFLTVDSPQNNVPDIPSGCTPAASNPPATIAQKPPPKCKLRISRARVFLFRRHPRLRLVARYRSAEPADVLINFIAIEDGNKVNLGDVTRHFRRHGLFRLREELSQEQSDTLWQTHKFIVHFKIPGEPGFCERKYTKELTVPRIVDGQRVVFQSDSKFGPGSPGHPAP
jgi:hypothetical protein